MCDFSPGGDTLHPLATHYSHFSLWPATEEFFCACLPASFEASNSFSNFQADKCWMDREIHLAIIVLKTRLHLTLLREKFFQHKIFSTQNFFQHSNFVLKNFVLKKCCVAHCVSSAAFEVEHGREGGHFALQKRPHNLVAPNAVAYIATSQKGMACTPRDPKCGRFFFIFLDFGYTPPSRFWPAAAS